MIVSGTIVLYGADYIGYAVKSVYDKVDKVVISYTDRPSHGNSTDMPCPESKKQVKDAVYHFGDPDKKIVWYDGVYSNETEHRSFMEQMCWEQGADQVLILDADEVWTDEYYKACFKRLLETESKILNVQMWHLFRSFDWYCTEPCSPKRVLNKHGKDKVEYIGHLADGSPSILHFGYAQKPTLMSYKWKVHGHLGELRKDCDWFKDVFLKFPERRIDLHPTCVGTPEKSWWDAVPCDKGKFPEFMRQHPFYNSGIISDF